MKDDVEKSIAPKEETIIEVELTTIQRTYYMAIYDKNLGVLAKGTKGQNVGSMMNIMLQLRKCCNHPFLLKGVEQVRVCMSVRACVRVIVHGYVAVVLYSLSSACCKQMAVICMKVCI